MQGTLDKTHPWITFKVDFSRLPAKTWIMLGECQSKCENISRVILKPATAQELQVLYLAKGVLATTAIEGNTLSEEEVIRHLEGKLELPPSRGYLKIEIENILEACNEMAKSVAANENLPITVSRIKDLNRIVLRNLPVAEDVRPGEIRSYSVGVARYKAPPAELCEGLLERFCKFLNSDELKPQTKDNKRATAILRAILAHLYFAWIHPFGDGNGRVARLLEFQILFASGIPAPAAHLLSNHYNQTRTEYYRQLDYASRSKGTIEPFINYAVQGLLDGLRGQLERISEEQLEVAWTNFIHEVFSNKTSPAFVRRRHLIIDLSRHQEVPVKDLTTVSPRVAAEYAKKTHRTLNRDLDFLVEKGLVERSNRGCRARKETMLHFKALVSRGD